MLFQLLTDFVGTQIESAGDAVRNMGELQVNVDDQAFNDLAQTTSSGASGILGSRNITTKGPLAIVIVGFMVHLAIEMWSFKPKLDFKPHLIRLVVYSTLIISYVPFSQAVSGFVMSFGAISASKPIEKAKGARSFLADQKEKFNKDKLETKEAIRQANEVSARQANERVQNNPEASTTDKLFSEGKFQAKKAINFEGDNTIGDALVGAVDDSLSALLFGLMSLTTEASFLFAALALYFLKMLQAAMMSVILGLGPLMIAFGSWPGVTSRYLSSWLSALIETAAWGFVAKIFIDLLTVNTQRSAEGGVTDANFFTYIGLNVLYAASLLSVPVITSSILRGSAGGGVSMAGMMGAAAATARGVKQMATSAGKGAASAAGNAGNTIMDRMNKGDSGGGSSGAGGSSDSSSETRSADKASDRAFHRNKAANDKSASERDGEPE